MQMKMGQIRKHSKTGNRFHSHPLTRPYKYVKRGNVTVIR